MRLAYFQTSRGLCPFCCGEGPSWHSRLKPPLREDGLVPRSLEGRGEERAVLRATFRLGLCPLACGPRNHHWPLPAGRVSWPGTGLLWLSSGHHPQATFCLVAFTSAWTSRAYGTHSLPLLLHFPVLTVLCTETRVFSCLLQTVFTLTLIILQWVFLGTFRLNYQPVGRKPLICVITAFLNEVHVTPSEYVFHKKVLSDGTPRAS